jgi:Rrf2 family protein
MISMTAEYALRAAVLLAQRHGQALTTRDIADVTKIPAGYVSKILQAMVRNRLVLSQRGVGGGFKLARHPDQISVLDVFAAVDSPIKRIEGCPLGIPGHVRLCPVHKLVDDAIASVEDSFRRVSMGDLLRSTAGIVPLCETAERIKALVAQEGG